MNFSLPYVKKTLEKLLFLTKKLNEKTQNSRIFLKTQARKLNFRHFQNRWISAKCTKNKKACDTHYTLGIFLPTMDFSATPVFHCTSKETLYHCQCTICVFIPRNQVPPSCMIWRTESTTPCFLDSREGPTTTQLPALQLHSNRQPHKSFKSKQNHV